LSGINREFVKEDKVFSKSWLNTGS
jgi:hypothetical protein